MRHLVLQSVGWTALVLLVVLFWPWGLPGAGCWRLVDPPVRCLAQLAEANERLWLTQTVPMLAVFASGYLVVALLALRRVRRSKERGDSKPTHHD